MKLSSYRKHQWYSWYGKVGLYEKHEKSLNVKVKYLLCKIKLRCWQVDYIVYQNRYENKYENECGDKRQIAKKCKALYKVNCHGNCKHDAQNQELIGTVWWAEIIAKQTGKIFSCKNDAAYVAKYQREM